MSSSLRHASVVVMLALVSTMPRARAEEPTVTEKPRSPIEIRDADVRRRTLFRRPDENRPDEQWSIRLGSIPVTIGGEFQVRARLDENRRLSDAAHEDETRFDQKLEVELFAPLSEQFFLYAEGRTAVASQLYAQANAHRSARWVGERGEMWAYWAGIADSPLSLQVGRQRFTDSREWFWDEDLDAIRLHFDTETIHTELALAQQLTRRTTLEHRIEPEVEDVSRLLVQVEWAFARRQRASLFLVRQLDRSSTTPSGTVTRREREDESDADLVWLGISARGAIKLGPAGRLGYWADAANVRGRETSIDFDDPDPGSPLADPRTSPIRNPRIADSVSRHPVRGTGLDIGLTWSPPLYGKPSLTLGYAFGSGDRDSIEHADRGFRQTGLQDNNGRFRGVNRFRYYGQFLDPELANLEVFTVGVGWPLSGESSIEFVYHRYEQPTAAPFLRDTRLRAQPNGMDHRLGEALDVIIGLEEWEHLELEIIGSAFRAGRAFGPDVGDRGYYAAIEIDWNF